MTGTCQDVRPETKGPRKADFRSGHRQLGSLIAMGNNDGGDGKDEHREMLVLMMMVITLHGRGDCTVDGRDDSTIESGGV